MIETRQLLHIINDEKFVDELIYNYENLYPGKNRFIIILFNRKGEIRFIKEKNKIEHVYYKSLIPYLNNIVHSETALFLHGVDRIKLKVLNKFKNNSKITIHFWGADIYLLPRFKNKLLEAETLEIFNKSNSLFFRLKDNYRGHYYHHKYKKLFKFVSFFSTVIPTEKEYLKDYLPTAKYMPFNYADIESLKLKHFIRNENATDVLIGNSSSYTSNHIDILNIINEIKVLRTAKKILPLNYGDVLYASEVKEYVKNNKIENIATLTEFLAPDEYVRILSNCSIAIMYHQRQQAVGTILICLWLGMRLFLSETNPVYRHYKDQGMVLFSIEKELNQLKQNSLLNINDIENNRGIIESTYSKDKSLQNIIDLVNLVTNE